MTNLIHPRRDRTERRARVTFQEDQLELVDGTLVERMTGLVLAKLPPGLCAADVVRLTVTSTTIDIRGNRLTTQCSGPCGASLPLHAMGLRNMGDGVLRNQPQCPQCRGRYQKIA